MIPLLPGWSSQLLYPSSDCSGSALVNAPQFDTPTGLDVYNGTYYVFGNTLYYYTTPPTSPQTDLAVHSSRTFYVNGQTSSCTSGNYNVSNLYYPAPDGTLDITGLFVPPFSVQLNQ